MFACTDIQSDKYSNHIFRGILLLYNMSCHHKHTCATYNIPYCTLPSEPRTWACKLDWWDLKLSILTFDPNLKNTGCMSTVISSFTCTKTSTSLMVASVSDMNPLAASSVSLTAALLSASLCCFTWGHREIKIIKVSHNSCFRKYYKSAVSLFVFVR